MDPRFPKLRSQTEIDAMVAAQTRTPILPRNPVLRVAFTALTQVIPRRKSQSRHP